MYPLTFGGHLPYTNLFSTLETVFEVQVGCLPDISLTEINSFFVSPPLISLPLDFIGGWRVVEPGLFGIPPHPRSQVPLLSYALVQL